MSSTPLIMNYDSYNIEAPLSLICFLQYIEQHFCSLSFYKENQSYQENNTQWK